MGASGDIMFGPWAAHFPVSLCQGCAIVTFCFGRLRKRFRKLLVESSTGHWANTATAMQHEHRKRNSQKKCFKNLFHKLPPPQTVQYITYTDEIPILLHNIFVEHPVLGRGKLIGSICAVQRGPLIDILFDLVLQVYLPTSSDRQGGIASEKTVKLSWRRRFKNRSSLCLFEHDITLLPSSLQGADSIGI